MKNSFNTTERLINVHESNKRDINALHGEGWWCERRLTYVMLFEVSYGKKIIFMNHNITYHNTTPSSSKSNSLCFSTIGIAVILTTLHGSTYDTVSFTRKEYSYGTIFKIAIGLASVPRRGSCSRRREQIFLENCLLMGYYVKTKVLFNKIFTFATFNEQHPFHLTI